MEEKVTLSNDYHYLNILGGAFVSKSGAETNEGQSEPKAVLKKIGV